MEVRSIINVIIPVLSNITVGNIFNGSIPPTKIYLNGCLAVIQSKLARELTLVLSVFTVIQVILVLVLVTNMVLSLCQVTNNNDKNITDSRSKYRY